MTRAPLRSLFALSLLAGAAGPALAADLAEAADDAAASTTPADNVHGSANPDIIVTAPYARQRNLVATAVSVLQGASLVRETRGTIGETLAHQPGVSATFFGPNASRPILRGLDAERVRVLTDGIGSFDVSNTSVDHAVAVNPLLADRIEVVRGPAALLYGSGAIGGVVNMRDLRIPREVPDKAVHVDGSANFGTAARERGGALAANAPLGGGLVAHVDGSFRETDDYRVGGFVFAKPLRDAAALIGGDVKADSLVRGRVENTGSRTWDVAGGLSWIGSDGANFGLAVSHLANRYGVPNSLVVDSHGPGPHDDHAHDDIKLDMRQTRVDVRGSLPLGGFFEALNVRGGWADYRHDELESDGSIGTTFKNRSWEARAELVQAARGGWKGASGVQFFSRNFDAVGAEAYIPANQTRQLGLFTLQEFDLGALRAEVGGRFEHADVRSDVAMRDRQFNSLSVSAGVSAALGGGFRLALSGSRSERAPAAEELFADGPHAATQAFEIGNPNFSKERQLGAELVLRGQSETKGVGAWRMDVSGFVNRFDNYIFLNPTGAEEDELPVFQYSQADTRFWGIEAEAAVTVARLGSTDIGLVGQLDYVNAQLLGNRGPVPRIPPLRLIGGVEANGTEWQARAEVEHVTPQNRLADFETRTPGWTMVNLSVSWQPLGAENPVTVVLSANNIFDVEARRHASFLKDFAPLPGRDIRLALRFAL
ncbi:MAG: TonB-dependent receptor [Sphingomonadales bacterium]|jgi:iron complex outermembrane receptor protein